jgi:hypothetical protein
MNRLLLVLVLVLVLDSPGAGSPPSPSYGEPRETGAPIRGFMVTMHDSESCKLPMNRARKLLEMNGTIEIGSWAVSRSVRNKGLSMNRSAEHRLGARP